MINECMDARRRGLGSKRRGVLVYRLVFGFSLALYQFGFAVDVSFQMGSIPFGEVWGSAKFEKIWNIYLSHDLLAIVLAGLVGGGCLFVLRADKGRAILLTVIALIGMAHFDFFMSVVMFLTPLIVAGQFLGGLDGESYCEGIHQAGAMGLFVLFCFGYSFRSWWKIWKSNKGQEERIALATTS